PAPLRARARRGRRHRASAGSRPAGAARAAHGVRLRPWRMPVAGHRAGRVAQVAGVRRRRPLARCERTQRTEHYTGGGAPCACGCFSRSRRRFAPAAARRAAAAAGRPTAAPAVEADLTEAVAPAEAVLTEAARLPREEATGRSTVAACAAPRRTRAHSTPPRLRICAWPGSRI